MSAILPKRLIVAAIFTVFLWSSCDSLEYSPNQAFTKNSPTDLNAKNLAKLASQTSADDTLRFILSGDTQRSYDQAIALVNLANTQFPKLDFVILNGDISDFGLVQEMIWITDIYQNLKVPYIAVIGNHDLVANGKNAYEHMFGPLNFSFVYKKVKFICHDDSSREYNFNGKVPDLNWLATELETGPEVESIVGTAHVPPRGGDFDPKLEDDYVHLFNNNPKVVACIFAHENNSDYYYPIPGGVPFIVTDAVTNRECLYIEIADGKLIKHENISY